jgi:FkbM family methyltransferase
MFRGGHILDIGANIGYCSALFARAADPGRRIYAFEPEPFNFSLLERAMLNRNCGSVVPVRAAVGAAEGEIRLRLNPRHHGDHRVDTASVADAASIPVPLVTIDAFLERRAPREPVAFIKIDVQGFEPAVCAGAGRTLAENPACSVALEYTPDAMQQLGFSPPDLLEWFKARGYRCYTLPQNGRPQPGPPETLPARGYIDLLFSRHLE